MTGCIPFQESLLKPQFLHSKHVNNAEIGHNIINDHSIDRCLAECIGVLVYLVQSSRSWFTIIMSNVLDYQVLLTL